MEAVNKLKRNYLLIDPPPQLTLKFRFVIYEGGSNFIHSYHCELSGSHSIKYEGDSLVGYGAM
jgi:hypothetical protein